MLTPGIKKYNLKEYMEGMNSESCLSNPYCKDYNPNSRDIDMKELAKARAWLQGWADAMKIKDSNGC